MSDEQKEYTVKMRLTYTTTVTVKAMSVDEANTKAEECEWVDDGMHGAELVGAERRGIAKEAR